MHRNSPVSDEMLYKTTCAVRDPTITAQAEVATIGRGDERGNSQTKWNMGACLFADGSKNEAKLLLGRASNCNCTSCPIEMRRVSWEHTWIMSGLRSNLYHKNKKGCSVTC